MVEWQLANKTCKPEFRGKPIKKNNTFLRKWKSIRNFNQKRSPDMNNNQQLIDLKKLNPKTVIYCFGYIYTCMYTVLVFADDTHFIRVAVTAETRGDYHLPISNISSTTVLPWRWPVFLLRYVPRFTKGARTSAFLAQAMRGRMGLFFRPSLRTGAAVWTWPVSVWGRMSTLSPCQVGVQWISRAIATASATPTTVTCRMLLWCLQGVMTRDSTIHWPSTSYSKTWHGWYVPPPTATGIMSELRSFWWVCCLVLDVSSQLLTVRARGRRTRTTIAGRHESTACCSTSSRGGLCATSSTTGSASVLCLSLLSSVSARTVTGSPTLVALPRSLCCRRTEFTSRRRRMRWSQSTSMVMWSRLTGAHYVCEPPLGVSSHDDQALFRATKIFQ